MDINDAPIEMYHKKFNEASNIQGKSLEASATRQEPVQPSKSDQLLQPVRALQPVVPAQKCNQNGDVHHISPASNSQPTFSQ